MSRAAALAALASWLTPDASGNIVHSAPPAQFDNSGKLATTGFVQRALGNYQKVIGPPGSTTLQATDIGSYVEYTAGSGITTTLPSAVACAGGAFTFYNNTAFTVSIAAAAGQTINVGRSNITSFNLTAGDNAIVISDGASWSVLGSMQMAQSSLFGASFSTPGYQKLPNGIIVQWTGWTASGASPNVAYSSTATLPIAFPSNHFVTTGAAHDVVGGFSGMVALVGQSLTLSSYGVTVISSTAGPSVSGYAISIGR